jgi:hypothetical protein
MAASYTSIGTATPIANIATALAAKGLISTNHYQNTEYLIISTPICSKVIKIRWASSRIIMSYGDAYTSGSTITNEVAFCGNGAGTVVGIHLVADTTFFALVTETGAGASYTIGYVGALTNGDQLVFGLNSTSTAAYYASCLNRNLTDGVDLLPITWPRGFSNAGTLLAQPLLWYNTANKFLELNSGNLAGTVGVRNVSFIAGATQVIVGVNSLITPGVMYSATAAGQATYSSLLLEW